jgi:hypothetical protein
MAVGSIVALTVGGVEVAVALCADPGAATELAGAD